MFFLGFILGLIVAYYFQKVYENPKQMMDLLYSKTLQLLSLLKGNKK